MLFDLLVKSTSIAELIKEVEVIDSFENLNEFNDVGTFYFRQNFNFVECALL